MNAAMKAEGGDVRYTEYPGVGHDSWTKAYDEEELFKWMLSKSLNGNTEKEAANRSSLLTSTRKRAKAMPNAQPVMTRQKKNPSDWGGENPPAHEQGQNASLTLKGLAENRPSDKR